MSGRGLMAEAVSLVVTHAFRELGLHRLEANIQPGNEPSRSLVKRLGFRQEGYSPRYLKIDGEWREGCEDCLRRTAPIDPVGRTPIIGPPPVIAFECEYRIAP